MDYQTLKEKYEKELNDINFDIEHFKNSNNAELKMAVKSLEKEKEEIELLLKTVNYQIQNHEHRWWYEDDGWGIVGWSFKCEHCGMINRFVCYPQEEMNCNHCIKENKFTEDEVKRIEKSL